LRSWLFFISQFKFREAYVTRGPAIPFRRVTRQMKNIVNAEQKERWHKAAAQKNGQENCDKNKTK